MRERKGGREREREVLERGAWGGERGIGEEVGEESRCCLLLHERTN